MVGELLKLLLACYNFNLANYYSSTDLHSAAAAMYVLLVLDSDMSEAEKEMRRTGRDGMDDNEVKCFVHRYVHAAWIL